LPGAAYDLEATGSTGPEESGYTGTVTGIGVREQSARGGLLTLTVDVGGGESNMAGRVR
jgi:hypothetical protein